ncbi:MAG: hypothetical protein KAI79_14435, partial [Bacteroidales bacterium]|nr:hypothetical protein [Bacteroidales bacterium]
MSSLKITKISFAKSGKIEKYGCLLGDLTLKVGYKSSNYEGNVILNYSFQFNKDFGEFCQTTFALKNESQENYVFNNIGCWNQKQVIAILERRLKTFTKKNSILCESINGDVELFLTFLESSFKLTEVSRREDLFTDS